MFALQQFAFLNGGGPSPARYVSVGSQGQGPSNNLVDAGLPAGWAKGDLLLYLVSTNSAASTGQTLATPSGYTLINNQTGPNNNAGNLGSRVMAFYKVATSSETASTSMSGLTDSNDFGSLGYIFAYRGVKATGPIEANAAVNLNNNTTTIPYGTPTTLGESRLVLQVFSMIGNGTPLTTSPGGGWTARSENRLNRGSLIVHEKLFPSAGAVPGANMTIANAQDGSARCSFAIVPAA